MADPRPRVRLAAYALVLLISALFLYCARLIIKSNMPHIPTVAEFISALPHDTPKSSDAIPISSGTPTSHATKSSKVTPVPTAPTPSQPEVHGITGSSTLTVLAPEQPVQPFVLLLSRGGLWTHLLANTTMPAVLDANVSLRRKGLFFLLRDIGTQNLVNPKITARVGSPNKLVCVDFVTFGLSAVGASDDECDSAGIDPLPDIPANQIIALQQEPHDFPFRVVFDEPEGTKYFNMDVSISGDNVPAARYGVQVQYYGLYP